MVSNSCVVERLLQHDLNIVFPHKDDIERLHQIIVNELTNNIFTEESKLFYMTTMQRLHDEQKVEGIILGCTGEMITVIFRTRFTFNFFKEISLLIKQDDLPHIPLFDSAQLHVNNK